MARYAKRTDANHAEIRDELRKAGYTVIDTSHIGNGYPDLTVIIGCKLPILLEVKDPSKPKSSQSLTDKELEFFELFMPICYVVTSIETALVAIAHGRLTQSKWI